MMTVIGVFFCRVTRSVLAGTRTRPGMFGHVERIDETTSKFFDTRP